jgi:hypothetical protein
MKFFTTYFQVVYTCLLCYRTISLWKMSGNSPHFQFMAAKLERENKSYLLAAPLLHAISSTSKHSDLSKP